MGYSIQSKTPDATVKVNAGMYKGQIQTDFIISEPGFANEHRHIVFDLNGNMVYGQINSNH